MAIGTGETATIQQQEMTFKHRSNVIQPSKPVASCGLFDIWDPFSCGFGSIWLSCRDTLCSLPEETTVSNVFSNNSNRMRTASNVFLDPCCYTIQHKDSMSTATPREIDPERVFSGQRDTVTGFGKQTPILDDASCDSSISSKGINCRADRARCQGEKTKGSVAPPSEIDTSS